MISSSPPSQTYDASASALSAPSSMTIRIRHEPLQPFQPDVHPTATNQSVFLDWINSLMTSRVIIGSVLVLLLLLLLIEQEDLKHALTYHLSAPPRHPMDSDALMEAQCPLCSFSSPPDGLPLPVDYFGHRYMLFDLGGRFNNQRQALSLALLFARVLKRTLVIDAHALFADSFDFWALSQHHPILAVESAEAFRKTFLVEECADVDVMEVSSSLSEGVRVNRMAMH
jgi:hypothetical protein